MTLLDEEDEAGGEELEPVLMNSVIISQITTSRFINVYPFKGASYFPQEIHTSFRSVNRQMLLENLFYISISVLVYT